MKIMGTEVNKLYFLQFKRVIDGLKDQYLQYFILN